MSDIAHLSVEALLRDMRRLFGLDEDADMYAISAAADQAVRERDEALRVIAKVRRTWKVRADRLATAPADQEQT